MTARLPLARRVARARTAAGALVVALCGTGLAAVTGSIPASADPSTCSPGGVTGTPDTTLGSLFTSYGNAGIGTTWTGADAPHGVTVPDGRTFWFFDDTFFGTVSPLGIRSHAPLVRNTLMIQDSGALTATLYTPTTNKPAPFTLVPPPAPGKKPKPNLGLWPGGATVEGDQLYVTLSEYKFTQATFKERFLGNWLADYQLNPGQNPTLNSIIQLPVDGVDWGPILNDGSGTTYIYGYANGNAYVAETLGSISGSWWYLDSSDYSWSQDAGKIGPVSTAAGGGFSVAKVGNAYMLVTMGENVVGFSPNVDVEYSCSALGPFSTPTTAYVAPEPTQTWPKGYGNIVTYDAHAQPAVPVGANQLEVSYDVRPTKSHKALNDVTVYRPRYVTLTFG